MHNHYDDLPTFDNLIESVIISFLHTGGENTSTIKWNASNGTHDIWVVVDPLDEIAESFENNNNASKQIFVDDDFDGDGIGDMEDEDDDDDGYNDIEDEFPYNSTEWSDLDKDGIGDNRDEDIDGDGVPNPNDSFPFNATEWLDSDGDEIGNNADDDDDNDGLLDSYEDKNGNGIVDPRETDPLNPDTDGDGVDDKKDFNPLNPKVRERPEAELSLLIILIWLLTIIVILISALGTLKRRKPRE